jgi:hypothetical protein
MKIAFYNAQSTWKKSCASCQGHTDLEIGLAALTNVKSIFEDRGNKVTAHKVQRTGNSILTVTLVGCNSKFYYCAIIGLFVLQKLTPKRRAYDREISISIDTPFCNLIS